MAETLVSLETIVKNLQVSIDNAVQKGDIGKAIMLTQSMYSLLKSDVEQQ